MNIQEVKDYIENHKERFINELVELLKIPSVSADSAYDSETKRCANHVKQSLLDVGVDFAEVCPHRWPTLLCMQRK